MTTPEDRFLQPPILTNWPYKVQGYRSRAPTSAQVVVDGVGSLDWRVWSLFVSFSPPNNNPDVTVFQAAPTTTPDNGVNLQLLGLLDSGMPYERRFSLAARRSLVFDCSAFRDVRVTLVGPVPANTGFDDFRVFVNATNVPIEEVSDREYYLAETYPVPGFYSVPPGASAVAAYQLADPGLEWRANGSGFVAPAALGAASPVRGTVIRTTVANMRIVWRIAQ